MATAGVRALPHRRGGDRNGTLGGTGFCGVRPVCSERLTRNYAELSKCIRNKISHPPLLTIMFGIVLLSHQK
jgi:hypothetical protein